MKPSIFVKAAKLIYKAPQLYSYGCCRAIAQSGRYIGDSYRQLFASIYEEDGMAAADIDTVFYYGPTITENKEARMLALLFAAEVAKDGGL